MHIVHYHKSIRLEHGGVVRAVLDLSTVMAAHGHQVTLLTPDDTDVPESWRSGDGTGGVPRCHRVPATGPAGLFSRASMNTIRPHLEAADCLHLHGMWGIFNAQLGRLARKVGTPYIYSIHGMLDDWCMSQRMPKKRVYLKLIGKRALHEAALVHCTAEAELEQSRKWFPSGTGHIAPLPIDLADFEDLPGPGPIHARFPMLDDDRPTLLFLSRLHYKKGVEHLIEATKLLVDRGRNVRTFVVGSGDDAYRAKLESMVAELKLADHVIFPGFVAGREKVSLFETSDVFVLPTSQENFGFVLFEALAAKTPVVTTPWHRYVAGNGSKRWFDRVGATSFEHCRCHRVSAGRSRPMRGDG